MNTEISFNADDVIIAKDKDNGKEYYVIIDQDDEGCDWIQDECPVGHLITWYKDYSIGEGHSYDAPEDLWKDILVKRYQTCYLDTEQGRKEAREYSKLLMDWSNTRIVSREQVLDRYKELQWTSEPEDSPYFVCACTEDGVICTEHPLSTDKIENMTDDDLEEMWNVLDDISEKELRNMVESSADIALFPVYMYDHSGIAISVSNAEYPFNDRWDAGQIGWWYITKEEAVKEGWTDDKWKLSFLDCIKDYIEEFNEIESGNCWGFICAEKALIDDRMSGVSKNNPYRDKCLRSEIFSNRSDSCWGYVGNYEELIRDYLYDQDLEITGVLE